MEQYEKEMEEAVSHALPNEDDDDDL